MNKTGFRICWTSVAAASVLAVPNASANEPLLDEILVTAQKRQQSLQDVPITIAAFQSSDLEQSGISQPDDLQAYTPGLTISTVSGQASYTYIRGGGTNQFDPGSDPSVAYFIDEVYVTGTTGLQFELVDIERVEVLKGPQGTLFGRNAAAGAISITTKQPQDEFGGELFLNLTNEDGYIVKGSLTGPMSENTAYRLTAYSKQRDAFTNNLLSGIDDPGEVDQFGIRGAISIDVGESAEFRVTADYGSTDNGMTNQVNLLNPALVSPLVSVQTNGEDFWNRYYDVNGFVDNEFASVTAMLNWTLSIGELASISAYRNNETERLQDQDSSSANAFNIFSSEEADSFSQEIRLSNATESVDWVAGLYYYTSDTGSVIQTDFNQDSVLALFGEITTVNDHMIDVDSFAVFGQVTYRFADQWALTLGGRYTEDEKASTRRYTGNHSPAFAAVLGADYEVDFDAEWSSFDPMLSLDYSVSDRALIYLSWRNGFKSGGFQSLANRAAVALTPFDEETVSSIEFGLKTDLWDQRLRLNAAIYEVEYDDLQYSQLSDSGLGIIINNVGSASTTGLDLSMTLAPVEQLLLQMNYGYQDAQFDEYQSAGVDFSGNDLPRSPENQFSFIASYEVPVGGLNLTLRGEYNFVDDVFFDENNTTEFLGNRVFQDSYALVNARATLSSPSERWQLSLWGKNLGDEEVCGNILLSTFSGFAICAPSQPLTYGLSAHWFW